MRIFETGGKTNFVDVNDVLVGFDAWQSCCESFGYYFAAAPDKEGDDEIDAPSNLEAMIFDPSFFKEYDEGDSWGGGRAAFKLVDARVARGGRDAEMRAYGRQLAVDGGREFVYLVLYNHHNGYYSHGFSMETGGTVLHSGCI